VQARPGLASAAAAHALAAPTAAAPSAVRARASSTAAGRAKSCTGLRTRPPARRARGARHERKSRCRRNLVLIMQLTYLTQTFVVCAACFSAHVRQPSRTPRTAPRTASRPLTVISLFPRARAPRRTTCRGRAAATLAALLRCARRLGHPLARRARAHAPRRRPRPGRVSARPATRGCSLLASVALFKRAPSGSLGSGLAARLSRGCVGASRAARSCSSCRAQGAGAGAGARARAGARAAWRVGTRTPLVPDDWPAQRRPGTRSSWRGCSARGAM
jgi:hypothetical protein